VGKIFLFIALLCSIIGCSGSGPGGIDKGLFDGNPATRPTPGFTELEVRPATSTTLPAPSSFLKGLSVLEDFFEIEEARLFVRDLRLLDGADDSQFNLQGPFVIRLIQEGVLVDEALPEFGGEVVANGSYQKFDLGLEVLSQETIPAPAQNDPIVTEQMPGNSIMVMGSFEIPLLLNQSLVRFIFLSHQKVTLRIASPEAFELSGNFATLFLAFKVQTWLKGIEQNLLNIDPTLLAGGLLVLDTESNDPVLRAIALQIESNIDMSLRFAFSPDSIFSEAEVDETSFSQVLTP